MSAHVASTGALAATETYDADEIVAKLLTTRIEAGSTSHLDIELLRLAVLPLPDGAVLTLRVEAQFKTSGGATVVARLEVPLLPVSAP